MTKGTDVSSQSAMVSRLEVVRNRDGFQCVLLGPSLSLWVPVCSCPHSCPVFLPYSQSGWSIVSSGPTGEGRRPLCQLLWLHKIEPLYQPLILVYHSAVLLFLSKPQLVHWLLPMLLSHLSLQCPCSAGLQESYPGPNVESSNLQPAKCERQLVSPVIPFCNSKRPGPLSLWIFLPQVKQTCNS